MKLKHPSSSASRTLTASETRLLVRETLRIGANLASAPPRSPVPEKTLVHDSSFGRVAEDQFVDSSLWMICSEEIDGRRWNYFAESSGGRSNGAEKLKKNYIRAVSLQSPKAPVDVSILIFFKILPIY